jgi:hypothetical protein
MFGRGLAVIAQKSGSVGNESIVPATIRPSNHLTQATSHRSAPQSAASAESMEHLRKKEWNGYRENHLIDIALVWICRIIVDGPTITTSQPRLTGYLPIIDNRGEAIFLCTRLQPDAPHVVQRKKEEIVIEESVRCRQPRQPAAFKLFHRSIDAPQMSAPNQQEFKCHQLIMKPVAPHGVGHASSQPHITTSEQRLRHACSASPQRQCFANGCASRHRLR